MSVSDLSLLYAPLGNYFSYRLNQETEVRAVRRLAEGHSRQMLWVQLLSGGEDLNLVMRIEQDGIFGTTSEDEFQLMAALHDCGFPVARVRWLDDDPELFGQPFFVMDLVPGEDASPDRPVLRDFVETLDRLHRLNWQQAGLSFTAPDSVRDAIIQQIERWTRVYREASPQVIPLLEEAREWLTQNAPAEGQVAVVHGDPGPGNFVHAGGRVVALTDFEFCHLGSPHEDWVFCGAMRGLRSMDTAAWRELYKATLGLELSASDWSYWQIFNLYKGACANTTALRVFCKGENPAPNLAIVGTAVHQNFLRQLAQLILERS